MTASLIDPGDVEPWFDIVFVWAILCSFVLIGGGRIDVTRDGVRSRNVITERRYPWPSIETFEARMCVCVADSGGVLTPLWAVQRAKIAAMTGRRSRVDRVVEDLEAFRRQMAVAPDPGVRPTTRVVRLTRWEWAQIVGVYPAVVAAMWLIKAAASAV